MPNSCVPSKRAHHAQLQSPATVLEPLQQRLGLTVSAHRKTVPCEEHRRVGDLAEPRREVGSTSCQYACRSVRPGYSILAAAHDDGATGAANPCRGSALLLVWLVMPGVAFKSLDRCRPEDSPLPVFVLFASVLGGEVFDP